MTFPLSSTIATQNLGAADVYADAEQAVSSLVEVELILGGELTQ